MRIIVLVMVMAFSLLAQQRYGEVAFDVSYGIFGKLGVAKASVNIDANNNYELNLEAKATGLSKVLSRNKEEYYTSRGVFQNGIFVPNIYKKISKRKHKSYTKEYTFDHKAKKVFLKHTSRKLKDDNWKESVTQRELSYYTNSDILSLFCNISPSIKNLAPSVEHKYNAIGAKDQNGEVTIIVPSGEKLETVESSLDTDHLKFIIYINQKIFSSEKGELLLSMQDNGIVDKAVLKDVLFFGDIKATLTKD